jgi:hypothetical protein
MIAHGEFDVVLEHEDRRRVSRIYRRDGQQTILNATAKQLVVITTNSNYRKLGRVLTRRNLCSVGQHTEGIGAARGRYASA